MSWVTDRPGPDEYAPYYQTYVGAVPDGDILDTLAREIEVTRSLLAGVPADREGHRYAEGKWTVRGVIGHLIDAERVFNLRALWFARADPTPQPGWDENQWAEVSNADRRTLADLADEFAAVRVGTVALFRGFGDELARRRGTANEVEFTVRSLAWIAAGHERHHRGILQERYGI